MSPQSLQMVLALAFGFAVAGLCSSTYRLFTSKLPSFTLLSSGRKAQAIAAVPLLIVSAPFLIMRNTLLTERRDAGRFQFVFFATLVAGFWSLMSGLVLVRAVGLILA